MKPHRTPLHADSNKAPTDSGERGEALPAGGAQSADLRERLTQTRARIARTHSENPPQIEMDWDPEEQPTRQYSSDKWLMPRPSAAAPAQHANDSGRKRAISEERVREQPARARVRSGAIPVDPARRAAAHSAPDAPTEDDAEADARRAALLGSTASAAAWVEQAGMFTEEPAAKSGRVQARRSQLPEPSTEPGMFAPARRAEQLPPDALARPAEPRLPAADTLPRRTEPQPAAADAQPLGTFADIARRSVELTPASGTPAPAPARRQVSIAPYVSLLKRQLHEVGARIERTDARLRRRIVYSAAALGVIAAISRILFGTHEGARVLVTTTPANASVSLDGKPVEGIDNPHVLDHVAPGEHVLAIEKPGFVTQRHKLTLAAGEHEHPLTLKLTPLLQKVNVSVSSDPPGALIVLDGHETGRTTPADIQELAPGRHEVSLRLAGYAETKEAMVLPQDALLSIKLASLSEPRFAPAQLEARLTPSRAELRAQARELARERRAAAKAAKVLLRYRARMGLPPDPVAQELVDAYGPSRSAE